MKKIVALFIVSAIFSACEKEIDVDLNSSQPQIVIEGNITDQPGPYYVKISKSVNFSDANNFPQVSNALVIISDNTGITDTLTEISAGLYQTNIITGVVGNTYNLSVNVEGKSYYANSTMPNKVTLDSLRFTAFSNPGSENSYLVVPVYTDPANQSNNYRFVLSVNGVLDKSYIVFDDNVSNGEVNERPIISNSDDEITLGDTVSIEMRCIDDNTYLYFFALGEIASGGPGGGITPNNPPNNIVGNKSLGYFAAYTSQLVTQVVN